MSERWAEIEQQLMDSWGPYSDRKGLALIDACKRIAELEAERDELRELVRRAAHDSCVTTSDDPGCFYCDQEGPHDPQCEAARLLGEEVRGG